MERVAFDCHEYISMSNGKAEVLFFTSKGNLNFNIASEEGLKNILMIKEKFGLDDIGFSKQIHGDLIHEYDGEIHHCDGLITHRRNIGLGIFTADCVPIMLHDKENNIISAVHSGWKGTEMQITAKAVERMVKVYGSRHENISVFIGPHNRQCCYQIGPEVAEKFLNNPLYNGIKIVKDSKLNMENCIIRQCLVAGILEENIKSTGICTFCSSEYELYSYRRNNKVDGRLLSIIFVKD